MIGSWRRFLARPQLMDTIAAGLQLLFGGSSYAGPLNDLWIFNTLSRQWTAVSAQGIPPAPREMHSGTMADESRMIVFGGRGTDQQVGQSVVADTCRGFPSANPATYRATLLFVGVGRCQSF